MKRIFRRDFRQTPSRHRRRKKARVNRRAFKLEIKFVPDKTFRAVAADQKFSLKVLRFAVCASYCRRYVFVCLRQIFERGLPQNRFAVLP